MPRPAELDLAFAPNAKQKANLKKNKWCLTCWGDLQRMLHWHEQLLNDCVELLLACQEALSENSHCFFKIFVDYDLLRKGSEIGNNRFDHVRLEILLARNRVEKLLKCAIERGLREFRR